MRNTTTLEDLASELDFSILRHRSAGQIRRTLRQLDSGTLMLNTGILRYLGMAHHAPKNLRQAYYRYLRTGTQLFHTEEQMLYTLLDTRLHQITHTGAPPHNSQ